MTKINAINNKSYSLTTDTFITATLGDITAINGDIYLGDKTNTADSAYLTFLKDRAGATVQVNDQLAVLSCNGFDGTGLTTGAAILATVTAGTIAATRIPTALSFMTHDDAPGVALERLRIGANGGITVNTFAGATCGAVLSDTNGLLSAPSAGVAGTVLTSTGTGTLPTWQAHPNFFQCTIINANYAFADHETGCFTTIANGAVTYTLPVHASVGEVIKINGNYHVATDEYEFLQVAQNAGQWIMIPYRYNPNAAMQVPSTTTIGVGGSISAPNVAGFTLTCVVADLAWICDGIAGQINVI
jgi:hypothetical protein